MKKEFIEIIINNELSIEGFCWEERGALLEEALKSLQENPADWAKNQYYGYKNYAGFGDQRCDCEYGMGPRHGSIVFRIGRGNNFNPIKKELYIEFLLYFRDFRNKVFMDSDNRYYSDLPNLIYRKIKLEEELTKINLVLKD